MSQDRCLDIYLEMKLLGYRECVCVCALVTQPCLTLAHRKYSVKIK